MEGVRKGWDPFNRLISFEVGVGDHVRFWEDKWCGEMELRRTFPNLYNIAVNQEELVSSILVVEEGRVTWNPLFRRDLHDWEIDQLFEMLYKHQVQGGW